MADPTERLAEALHAAHREWVASPPEQIVNAGYADHLARAVLPIVEAERRAAVAEALGHVDAALTNCWGQRTGLTALQAANVMARVRSRYGIKP